MKSKLNWLEAVLLAGPFVVLALYWNDFSARVPLRWNLRGDIDWSGPKMPGLLVIPMVSLGIAVLLRGLTRFDPRLRRRSTTADYMPSTLTIARLASIVLCDAIFCVQAAVSLGRKIAAVRILIVSVLIFLALIGNFLGRLRPNYFVGIRTPWTLKNPETWRATHRLGGHLFFFGSLLLLVLQFFLSDEMLGRAFLTGILLLTIWVFGYSWHHAHQNPRVTI